MEWIYPVEISSGFSTGCVEILEALADPDHERHADMREWLGEEVDPFDFKPPPLRAALAERSSGIPPSRNCDSPEPRGSLRVTPLRLCRTMKWVLLHRE
jgi:hypothetical protein